MSVMALPADSSTTVTIRLKNTTDAEQELWIEPLGELVKLRPDTLYALTLTRLFEDFEIDLAGSGFVVHGWVTKVASIDDKRGEVLEWSLQN